MGGVPISRFWKAQLKICVHMLFHLSCLQVIPI